MWNCIFTLQGGGKSYARKVKRNRNMFFHSCIGKGDLFQALVITALEETRAQNLVGVCVHSSDSDNALMFLGSQAPFPTIYPLPLFQGKEGKTTNVSTHPSGTWTSPHH